jgi:microcystin-dependent protein
MPSEPYVGEIMMFGGNFAMLDWSFCNGAVMSISQGQALFELIGTTYGGNGQTTFNLPDLRSRLPVGMGQGIGLSPYVIGQSGGTESVTLTTLNMPQHNHTLNATSAMAASQNITTNSLPANVTSALGVDFYCVVGGDTTAGALAPGSVTSIGGGQPHENRMPSLCVTFCIALFGVFPSQA